MSSEIVIGIDFGTTYSGVSWAVNGGAKTVRLITNWSNPNGSRNQNRDKVPSVIAYEGSMPSKWGYTVTERDHSFRWIKILLEPESAYSGKAEMVKKSNELLNQLQKQAVSVAADYLTKIWEYTMEEIARHQGSSFRDDYNLKVVMSVPAMWTPAAKAKTLQAAKQAGLGDDVMLVTEPEAAALAVLRDKSEMRELRTGDCFVVCDAGGGTVDLISYEVQTIEPLVVKEVAIGTGGLCGSAYLDMGFQKWVCQLVGQEQWNKIKDSAKRRMVDDFEGLKRAFDVAGPSEYAVDLRGVKDDDSAGIRDDTIIVKKNVILTIFDHVCGQIKALVAQQVQQVRDKSKTVKAILLVGGFGDSIYLHSQLEAAHRNEGIKVLQVNGAVSAICRGATMWGLEHSDHFQVAGGQEPQKTVQARLARYSYGVQIMETWIQGKHEMADRVWDPADGEWCANNQMKWLIQRGDEFSEGQILRTGIRHAVSGIGSFGGAFSGTSRNFSEHLYYTDRIPAPSRFAAGGIKNLCDVEWQLREGEIWALCRSRKKNGVRYRDINFVVMVILGNADLGFVIDCGDQIRAMAEAKYPD